MEDLKIANGRNTVRAPGAPFARPRAALGRKLSINRESNALRASVVDAAMQIGLGANGAVTDWVYNNSINEEDEEEPISSSGLKCSSSAASFAVSEDWSSASSARFLYSPPSSSRSAASSTRSLFSTQKPFAPGALAIPEEPCSLSDDEAETASNITSNLPSSTFSDSSTMQLPSVRIPAKLKKRRGDGYESDGGYVSDAKGKKDSGSSASGKMVGKNGGAGKMDEKAKKKEFERRAKSASRGTEKDVKTGESLASKGYETDAPSRRSRFGRKKSGASDVGYETDAGYISSPSLGPKKSKSKFFRLGGKSSKPDLTESASPNVPSALKFGTQLPTLPPLPSLDASFTTSISTSTSLAEASSLLSPLSAPPTISVAPTPRAKSEEPKKDSASEKRVRDSHVSGESSRSSTSNASSGPLRETRTAKHKSFRFLSGPKSSPLPPSNKFPVISLPLGRTVSPTDVNVNQGQDSLSSDLLRSPSPSPSKSGSSIQESRGGYTPRSSALLSSSSQQGPAQPTLLSPTSLSVAISTSSAPSSPAISRRTSLRPRYSQLTVVTTSNPTTTSPALLSRGRSLSPNPSEWVVPPHLAMNTISPSSMSSGTLSVPNSNMLSYYDIPPPSPPPNAPLPKVPDTAQSDAEDDPFGINGRSVIRSLSRADRGKDVPFLSRLRARTDSFNNAKSNGGAKTLGKVTKQQISDPRPIINVAVHRRRRSDSSKDQAADNDDVGGQDMQDVLDRFAETSNHRDEREVGGMALGRSRSSEALRNESSSHPEPSSEGGDGDLDEGDSSHSRKRRSTLYYSDQEDGADPRLSRWSGSIYSRASFMDTQRSEETRARFVKRVEAMLDEAGIERGNKRSWEDVPPVPKLPEDLARRNILTRQKNQMKGVGPAENSWVQF